jgi:hypothetical protein
MTVCVTSGDCCEGYCYKGICRIPPTASLFLTNLFGKINSQIGCAGLIEECSPSETNCISLCSGLSLLLVAVSAGFGAYSWRRFGHPVAGMVAAFTPIVLGMLTYPFIGIIMSVVLISLLVSKS